MSKLQPACVPPQMSSYKNDKKTNTQPSSRNTKGHQWGREREKWISVMELQVWSDAAQRYFSETLRASSQCSLAHFSISVPHRAFEKHYRLSLGCVVAWFRQEEVNQTAMLTLEISGTHLAPQKPAATISTEDMSDCVAAQIKHPAINGRSEETKYFTL